MIKRVKATSGRSEPRKESIELDSIKKLPSLNDEIVKIKARLEKIEMVLEIKPPLE